MAGRGRVGGIVALLKLNDDTSGAVDYECMVAFGLRLPDAVQRFGWSGISLMVRHAGERSAIYRAQNPREAAFASDYQQSEILASVVDAVVAFAHGFSALKTDPPKYPRPGEDDGGEFFGSGAIPVQDFDKWFYS